jgi:DNA repair exonuclease SbcCD ATPase subunit
MPTKHQVLPECAAVHAQLTERLENVQISQERIQETQRRLADVVESLARAQLLLTSRLEMIEKHNQVGDDEKKELAEEERTENREIRGDRRKAGLQTITTIIAIVLALFSGVIQARVLIMLAEIHP